MVRVAAHIYIMKIKATTKDVTIRTLIALKKEIYDRATERARTLSQAGGDLKALAAKLEAIQKRADYDASKIAFAINMVRVRA